MSDLAVAALRGLLNANECDALLTTWLTHVRYLTGYSGSYGAALIAQSDQWLATDTRYEIQAANESAESTLLIGRDLVGLLLSQAADARIKRLGIESARLTVPEHAAIQARAADIELELVDASGWVDDLRLIKSDAETAAIEAACEITVASWWQLLAEGVVDRSEADLAGRLEHLFRLNGAAGRAFDSIVATGPNSAVPHHQPTDRLVRAGELLKIDCGALVAGYHADFTRTVAVGRSTDWQQEIHGIVQQVQAEVSAAVQPGADILELDRQAHAQIAAAGYGANFGHGTGHGVGLEIHEPPFLGRTAGILRPRMTVTVEPGIYLAGQGGVRIEDTLLVTELGQRHLTQAERGLLVV